MVQSFKQSIINDNSIYRCVDDVDQLYLLVRSKKERSATDRLADIFSNYVSV